MSEFSLAKWLRKKKYLNAIPALDFNVIPEHNSLSSHNSHDLSNCRLVSSCNSGNDFTLLGEPEPAHMQNLSTRLRVGIHRNC